MGIIGLTEAVLISIHRLCLRVKIRKIKSIHLYTPSFTIKVCLRRHVFLDPVVQSIVSLMISLRHKFVKQISAKVTNTLLFLIEKM